MSISTTYRLSPYCVFHVDPDETTVTVVHSLYGSRFSLAADLLPVLFALNNGTMLSGILANLSEDATAAIRMLIEENVLIATDRQMELSEPALFKGRLNPIELSVQRGFNEGGYFPEQVDPQLAPGTTKEVAGTQKIALQQHDMASLEIDMLTCLHSRRSIRAYSDLPLTKSDLEKFLQFTARAQSSVATPASGQLSFRPYPGGGALHPLEIYAIVYNVDTLRPGLYHYHPFRHDLTELECSAELRAALGVVARQKMPVRGDTGPAVLFVITAVFARMCWKYIGMPYQTILMETGALYQTMYLVAEALGLAPCAIGAFPERAVAEILGVDSRDEAQVGMFALGIPEQSDIPSLRITAARLVRDSLFANASGLEVLELTFADASRETMLLAQTRPERQADGSWVCHVRAGRERATMDASALSVVLSGLRR